MSTATSPLSPERIIAGADRAFGRAFADGAAAGGVLSLLREADIGLDEVARRLSRVPVVAAALLRIANSALYGQRGQVGSLPRALTVLGLDAVRGIVLATSVRHLGRQIDPRVLDGEAWLAHAVSTAVAARRLALPRLDRRQAEEAFAAGLLHDLGWALFAAMQPALLGEYRLRLAAGNDRDPRHGLAVERACFGLDHAECGAVVVQHWGLPAAIVAAVREHHAAAGLAAVAPLGAVLQAADRLSVEADHGLECEVARLAAVPAGEAAGTAAEIGMETAELLQALGPP